MIGRAKYVHSIVQQYREEKLSELRNDGVSLTSLLFNYGFGLGIGGGPLAELMGMQHGRGEGEEMLDDEDRMRRWLDEDLTDIVELEEVMERKFLGLNWWLLYVGWKDIGERVRKSVEEVFDGLVFLHSATDMYINANAHLIVFPCARNSVRWIFTDSSATYEDELSTR